MAVLPKKNLTFEKKRQEIERLLTFMKQHSKTDLAKMVYSLEKKLMEARAEIDELRADDDPTLYCSGCGAMVKKACDCGGIASNN